MPLKDPAERKAYQTAYDAARMPQQSVKGNLYFKQHPERKKELNRAWNEKRALVTERDTDNFEVRLERERTPITLTHSAILITSDWHVPFHDRDLLAFLLVVAEEFAIDFLSVGGDFWDCDNYSLFIRNTPMVSFKQETEAVRQVLRLLKAYFKRIYFCRGNHEDRWIKLNRGMMGMDELFGLTRLHSGYQVTMDDYISIIQNGQLWRHCHPKNYSKVPLSVTRELAAKHQCNIVGGHGHQLAQGFDKSGTFRIADGGGLYFKPALEYLRDTTTHPASKSGFYLLIDGELTPFELGKVPDV